jgi:spermidine synthase
MIFVDINTLDLEDMVPPEPFRGEQFITRCTQLLSENGILIFNTISLNSKLEKRFRRLIKRLFGVGKVFVYECEEELNHVYFLKKGAEVDRIVDRMQAMDDAQQWDTSMELVEIAKEIKATTHT